ncbi:MAG: hypothetical protein RLZZ299_450 [Pseudomonadota bacterium]|jgi:hypothetical protein
MISYDVYRIVHFAGLFLLFLSFGGLLVHVRNGGTREGNASRRWIAASHGAAMFLVLLGGFGMLARLGVHSLPGWIHGKLTVWALMAAALAIPYRFPRAASALWFVLPTLALAAAWLGAHHA